MADHVEIGSLAGFLGGVKLPNGLFLDEIELQGESVTIETDPLDCAFGQPMRVTVRVSASSLSAFMADQVPDVVRSLQVRFAAGRLLVESRVKFIVDITVEAVCDLEIVDGTELWVRLLSVDKPGPVHGILESQIEKQNPVFRTSQVPIAMRLVEHRITDQALEIVCEVTGLHA